MREPPCPLERSYRVAQCDRSADGIRAGAAPQIRGRGRGRSEVQVAVLKPEPRASSVLAAAPSRSPSEPASRVSRNGLPRASVSAAVLQACRRHCGALLASIAEYRHVTPLRLGKAMLRQLRVRQHAVAIDDREPSCSHRSQPLVTVSFHNLFRTYGIASINTRIASIVRSTDASAPRAVANRSSRR